MSDHNVRTGRKAIARHQACVHLSRLSCQNTVKPIFCCGQWFGWFVFVHMSTDIISNPQLEQWQRETLSLIERTLLLPLLRRLHSSVHQSLSHPESKACIWRIFIFDLFYGSLDALQLWAAMCLIDNERKGETKGERDSSEKSASESVAFIW